MSAIFESQTVVNFFWKFLIFYQFFISVKRNVKISNKNGMY